MTNLRTSKYFKDKTECKHKRQVIPKRDQILKKIITYWWDKCKLHKYIFSQIPQNLIKKNNSHLLRKSELTLMIKNKVKIHKHKKTYEV
jgi:hypothetical protein